MNMISLLKLFARQSLSQMLTYRLTSTFIVIFGTLFAVAEVVGLLVYYQFTDTIAGWGFYSFLLLIATFSFIQYIYQFFFVLPHEELLDKIINGELDYDLIRPVDSQILCSMKNLDFPSLINLIIPTGLIIYSWPHLEVPLTFINVIFYFALVLCGVIFYYLLNQFFVTLGFWIERPQRLSGLPEYFFEFSSRPRSIYPRFIQLIFTVIFPVITASNLPANTLRGKFNLDDFLILFSFIIIFCFVVRLQWNSGVRRYSSTN